MNNDTILYQVHNYMEEVVATVITNHRDNNPEMCKCERCFLDISAIVLNQIKPQYLKAELVQTRIDPILIADIVTKVEKASEQVACSPNHESENSEQGNLKNLSEQLVYKVINEVITVNNHEYDDERRYLIASYSLNQVEPRYAVTNRGGAYQRLAELEPQFLPATLSIVCNVIKQLEKELG